jgi:hypothetical protein
MMPPPPANIQQHCKVPSRATVLPLSRVTQTRDLYERDSNVPAPQQWNGQRERSSRPLEIRAHGLPKNRLLSTATDRSGPSYSQQVNDRPVHVQSMSHSTVASPTESSSGSNCRPAVEQQPYMPQPPFSQPFHYNNRFTHTRHEASQQEQQRQTREPLRPIPSNSLDLQTSGRPPQLHAGPKATLSPSRAIQPTVGSTNSPFLRREAGVSHIAPSYCPPTHGGQTNQPRKHHDSQLGATGNSEWLNDSIEQPNTQHSHGIPMRMQRSSHYGHYLNAPSSATLPYCGSTAMPQAPSDRLPLHDNRAYLSSSRHSFAEPHHMPASRASIALPPSKSGSQDYELSSIRELRSGYLQRAEGFSSHRESGYSGARLLFSATGRRSVRR